jgi:hypothetical protein
MTPMAFASRRLGRSVLGALAVLALVGAGLASTSAVHSAGAAGTDTPAVSPPSGFDLPGSAGYAVEVAGVAAQEGSAAQVVVRVTSRRGAVTYRFPAVVEAGSIQADLGAYGQISVVFHPLSGGMSAAELGCSRDLSSTAGYYEGTISFHAEGLTAVDASRAKGSVGLALSLLCATQLEEERPTRPGTYLEVSGGPTAPSLTISQRRHGLATQIEAGISEHRGGVAIERSISVAASSGSFIHEGLRSATVSPPAPFTGSATFRRDGSVTSWRGNLRVSFPGRPGVALTGKGVQAQLRRARAR